jgi:uncharacterized protein
MLTQNSKQILLNAAREAVISAVTGDKSAIIETNEPQLLEKCGCFVTIKNKGRLRGCLGVFASSKPLIDMVTEMAASSATNDPRFYNEPITPEELGELDIEISVLSPLRETNDPASLRLGRDGVYIRRGMRSGCFLPQVAEETGWSVEEFLGNCCEGKAGLDYYSWKEPETKVYLFNVEIVKGSLK